MTITAYESFREGQDGRLEAERAIHEPTLAALPIFAQRDLAHSRDWLADIQQSFPNWQQPRNIDAGGEQAFAVRTRKHIASHLTSVQYRHDTFKIINGNRTDEALGEYYSLYPANDTRPEIRLSKRRFQQPYIEVAKQHQREYSELQIASGLWIRLREEAAQNRRYLHAARSLFGLITAYGMTLESERYRADQRND